MAYYNEVEEKNLDKIEEQLSHFPEYVREYINSIQFTTTTKTRIGYLWDLETFFDYVADVKNLPREEISTEVLDTLDKHFFDEYLRYLSKYEKNGHVYTNQIPALRRKLTSLKALFHYLFLDNKMKSCEITKVNTPKLRKKEIVYLDDEETNEFLAEVSSPTAKSPHHQKYLETQSVRDKTLTQLLYSTGIRVSECVGLNIQDINLEKCFMKIVRKGNKEATIYLSDEMVDILRIYMEHRKTIIPVAGHEYALFLSSQRKRLTQRSIERIVKKYAVNAIPQKHITPHKLRASYATAMNEKTDGNLLLVSSLLGHESVRTTQAYVVQSERRKEEVRNILSKKPQNDNAEERG